MPAHRIGTASSTGSATFQPAAKVATVVSTVATVATSTDGTANRTVCDSASTSRVVRVTRSPVPARSTVDSGSATTRSMNCSRSWANTVSPSTNDCRRAKYISTVCTTIAAARKAAQLVDLAEPGAVGDLVHQPADQRRAGQPGDRGEAVQAEHDAQPAAVLAGQHLGLAAHAVRPGDGELGRGRRSACVGVAHSSSPRITVCR